MNTTGTVLFVRGADAGGGGPGALEGEFEVVVADGAIDAVKRLSRGGVTPDCVVAQTSIADLSIAAFIERVRRDAPETGIVVVGELPSDGGAVSALVQVDGYVPAGQEATIEDRVRHVLEERRLDRAIDAHDRLAETVRRVAVATAGAADRRAIESAVYDELVDAEGYQYIWIARREDEALEVTVPVDGRLGQEDLGDLVGGGDPTFATRAVETGQVASTHGRVPSRSAAAQVSSVPRYDGGETGRLASAAIPFVHDGRVFGVGIVSTERAGAFDSAERAALADLGTVVGHALWAVEARSASPSVDLGRGMENLVHDLRNPLGIARSHLHIAREEDAEGSLDRVDSALDRMEETIDRVAAGIAGEPQVSAVEIDLGTAARTAWDSIDADGATLDVDDTVGITADRDLLVRLLSNLFQNAVDHAGETVSVRVGVTGDGFAVEDDGPGIPEGERDDVFDRGYSTSRDGLGIGLSIVQDVVTAHGWDISVDESAAGGARFEVTGVDVVADDQAEGNETA